MASICEVGVRNGRLRKLIEKNGDCSEETCKQVQQSIDELEGLLQEHHRNNAYSGQLIDEARFWQESASFENNASGLIKALDCMREISSYLFGAL